MRYSILIIKELRNCLKTCSAGQTDSKKNKKTTFMKIEALTIYPVKSLRGISLRTAKVTKRGLEHDRRWMITDSNFNFITQRTHPVLALIEVKIQGDTLQFNYSKGHPSSIEVPAFPLRKGPLVEATVFDKKCKALPVSKVADEWFSSILEGEYRLVYMPEESKRLVKPEYDAIVSFADGYPILLAGAASLADLNAKLEQPVPMNRFRPNIVISGEASFGEDHWEYFTINGLSFWGVKPCSRCLMTTVDQSKGVKSGAEPLKTLSTYRKVDNKVKFGLNVVWEHLKWDGEGDAVLGVGDEIVVEHRRAF